MDDSIAKTSAEGGAADGLARPRVLIAEDQTVLREVLHAMLDGRDDVEVLGGCDDSLYSIRTLKPDVVLIHLSMPDMGGLGAIAEIKRRSPQTKTVVLTAYNAEECIRAALNAGADGYVLKEASRAELLMAIETVLRGKSFISPSALENMVGTYPHQKRGAQPPSVLNALTVREKQVLKLIAEAQRNRQIAEQLGISVKTVEKHRSNLMHKLKLHNTAALTGFAIEHRIAGKAKAGRSRDRV